MRVHSYVVEHDLGFAPNPYHGMCTLANCKPVIRQYAKIGDILLGFGSKNIRLDGKLIYWMKISDILSFDAYWRDDRFKRKKPVMNGSLMQVYGDNIYYTDDNGVVAQEFSFHSKPDGSKDMPNLNRDTGRTNRVLIADRFSYYGIKAIDLPQNLQLFVKRGRGHKSVSQPDQIAALEAWLGHPKGVVGRPSHWPKTQG